LSPVALVLILSSAFFHALWNALLKRQEDPESALVGIITVAMLTSGVWALGLEGQAFPTPSGMAWAVGAGVLEAGYLVSLARSLRRAPLGLAYTVARGGAILLVWPASVLWLDEPFTLQALLGATVLGLGLALTNLARLSAPALAGVWWASLSAACIAGYNLAYKRSIVEGAQPPALFALSMGVALALVLALVHRGPESRGALRRQLVSHPLRLVGAGLLCTLSFALVLLGLQRTGAASVLTLRNTSIVFAYGFGALQGESFGRLQLTGLVLVLLGTVVLGWPR
jgi:drug/metabolite transporter (DMT)-like permease